MCLPHAIIELMEFHSHISRFVFGSYHGLINIRLLRGDPVTLGSNLSFLLNSGPYIKYSTYMLPY